MSERVCKGCRFYEAFDLSEYGQCRRNRPADNDGTFPPAVQWNWCGEWRDKTITPEQEERRELIRRFAVALMSTEWARPASPLGVWQLAIDQVDSEPDSSEIPKS